MPTAEQYDELLTSTERLVEVARRIHPKAGLESVEIICTAAVQTELAEREAAER